MHGGYVKTTETIFKECQIKHHYTVLFIIIVHIVIIREKYSNNPTVFKVIAVLLSLIIMCTQIYKIRLRLVIVVYKVVERAVNLIKFVCTQMYVYSSLPYTYKGIKHTY